MNEEYEKYCDELALVCSCCPDCGQDIPCGGLLTGNECEDKCECLYEDGYVCL